jgi:hypothetical protein
MDVLNFIAIEMILFAFGIVNIYYKVHNGLIRKNNIGYIAIKIELLKQ